MNFYDSMSRFQFMTNINSVLSKQSLSSIFLYLGSSCHDTINIYFMLLPPITISHLRDRHIFPDIKYFIMKLFAFYELPHQES